MGVTFGTSEGMVSLVTYMRGIPQAWALPDVERLRASFDDFQPPRSLRMGADAVCSSRRQRG